MPKASPPFLQGDTLCFTTPILDPILVAMDTAVTVRLASTPLAVNLRTKIFTTLALFQVRKSNPLSTFGRL